MRRVLFASFLTLGACVGKDAAEKRPYPAPSVATGGDVVAKVGPVTLTTEELERRINGTSPFIRQRLQDPEKRKEFAETEVRFELLAQEGWRRGLYDDPEVVAELKKAIVQRVVKEETEKPSPALNVTEDELRRAYAQNQSEYVKPERIRISQIVRSAATPQEKASARKLLEKLQLEILAKEKANTPNAFATAAKEHSQDEATKDGGGDLEFVDKAQLEEKYGADVAAKMFDQVQVGDMAVLEAADKVLLLRKTGRRRGVERTLEMVKPQLRAKLINEKKRVVFEAMLEDLKQKAGVKLDDAALAKIKIDMAAPTRQEHDD